MGNLWGFALLCFCGCFEFWWMILGFVVILILMRTVFVGLFVGLFAGLVRGMYFVFGIWCFVGLGWWVWVLDFFEGFA